MNLPKLFKMRPKTNEQVKKQLSWFREFIRKNCNTRRTLIEMIQILENKGIIIEEIKVTKELAKRMTSGRRAIDNQYEKDPFGLLFMDDEFTPFVSKKKITNRKLLKTKPKGFIGMMFGINIITEEVKKDGGRYKKRTIAKRLDKD